MYCKRNTLTTQQLRKQKRYVNRTKLDIMFDFQPTHRLPSKFYIHLEISMCDINSAKHLTHKQHVCAYILQNGKTNELTVCTSVKCMFMFIHEQKLWSIVFVTLCYCQKSILYLVIHGQSQVTLILSHNLFKFSKFEKVATQ